MESSTESPPLRLAHRRRNTAHEAASLAQKSTETSKTEGTASGSDSGPTILVEENYASTEPALQRPIQYLAISREAVSSQWATGRDKVWERLTSEGFNWRSVGVHRIRGSNSSDTQTRLVIEVDSGEQRSRWRDIITSSRLVLSQHHCSDLGVEIILTGPRSNTRVFAIKAEDPNAKNWPELRDKIVKLLPSYEWALDLLLYGETLGEAKPTIFVTLGGKQDDGCSQLQRKIQESAGKIPVVIRAGQKIMSGINNLALAKMRGNQTYNQIIDAGWSTGVDEQRSGTLGGFINLCDPRTGARTTYGLTNYHVVRPEDDDFPAAVDRGGTKHPRWPTTASTVQCPSQADQAEEKVRLLAQIQELEDVWDSYAAMRAKIAVNHATEHQRMRLVSIETRLGDLRRRLDEVKGLRDRDLTLGTVAFYSGHREVVEKKDTDEEVTRRLDWALVKVEKVSRLGTNRLPDRDERPPLFSIASPRITRYDSDLEAQKLGLYLKIGRSTGLSVGKANGTRSAINLPKPKTDEDKTEGSLPPTVEHVLVPEEGETAGTFSKGGDSGSWVVDTDGTLAGMIFGESGMGATYWTPIELIIADIENRTGMKVELP